MPPNNQAIARFRPYGPRERRWQRYALSKVKDIEAAPTVETLEHPVLVKLAEDHGETGVPVPLDATVRKCFANALTSGRLDDHQ